MQVGFLGLGQMGAPIAMNLVRAGHHVTVWNRSPEKAGPLVALGATAAKTPKDAAAGKEVVMTMLADDAALETVLSGAEGLLAGLPAGALHLSMSTIGVATSERVAALHAERGQRYVAAPVFGRPEAAAAAKLFVVAAGAPADLETAAPIFAAIGQRVFTVSNTPAAANLVKLCGNFMILSAIEAMAEAFALAQKGGVAKAKLLEVLTGSLFDAPIYRNYGAILVEERFRPAGFTAPLGLKDMRLVGQAAEAQRVAMPLLSLLRDHLLETLAKEGEDIDWSGIGRTVARNAGL
ncbi:MAG: NAD(P)-dependent oxidoreductase [Acidobacteriia bacterium]|nr:NAD(P)-dependent oxidoreductase [Methyloceanibacter sp.]MBX5471390.1 NAD(P)-dependent oxidoreductase [Acetobacteraceae bacterium]MCL6490263.1 NAD(P)-dependent oxidoreductase [Terriglobia bacterium]